MSALVVWIFLNANTSILVLIKIIKSSSAHSSLNVCCRINIVGI